MSLTRTHPPTVTAPVAVLSRPRRYAFHTITTIICLALAVTSLHLLATGWFDNSDGGARRFDDIGWGAIEGVIVLGGLLTQLRRPDRHPTGLRQAALGLLALFIGGAVTGAFDPASIIVLALVGLLIRLHPARVDVLRRPDRPDAVVLGVAVVGAVPLLGWAAVSAHTAHTVASVNVHATHQDYAGLAGLAIGLALTALLATVDRRSMLPAISVGAALALVGVASLTLAGQADALPAGAAVAALVAAVAFPLLARARSLGVAGGRSVLAAAAVVATVALGASTLGATPRAEAATGVPVVTVTMGAHDFTWTGGDTVHAGRVIFRVRTSTGNHALQLFKLEPGYTLTKFNADLLPGLIQGSSPAATRRIFHGTKFFGGISAAAHHPGEFAETLYAGSYYLIDGAADSARTHILHVVGTPSPRAWLGDSSTIAVNDMKFRLNESALPADSWTLFRNADDEPHFMDMTRVQSGVTRQMVADALTSPNPPSWMIGPELHVGIVSPGTQIVFHQGMPPGKYLLICWIPDPKHGDMPHAVMGMYRLINIR